MSCSSRIVGSSTIVRRGRLLGSGTILGSGKLMGSGRILGSSADIISASPVAVLHAGDRLRVLHLFVLVRVLEVNQVQLLELTAFFSVDCENV